MEKRKEILTMKHKRLTIGLTVLLTLLLGVSGTMAQHPQPAREVSISVAVNSRISYQGVLKEDGNLVTGNRYMTFRLHADDACTTQVGNGIVKPSVPVVDGLFSVELDVAHANLNGQGLWLEVEMDSTAIVCQEVLPVPYALSLRPGATIMGEQAGSTILTVENSSPANDSKAIRGYASAATGFTAGVNGRTDSVNTGAKGVWGYSAATSGQTYGVHGESNSSSGRGVYGRANASSGANYGVYGQTNSPDGYAVYGDNTAAGTGVYGGGSTGVHGVGSIGVEGEADGIGAGVKGVGNALSYGVWASNPDSIALYVQGGGGLSAAFIDGDVAQSRADNGLVKAGVYAVCGTSPSVDRSFNNVGGTISVSSGGGTGSCIIDFGFQVNDRFWVATAGSAAARIVTCVPGAANDRITCYRYDHQGAVENGYIMVMVY
jgi:hypothetical protein